MTITEYCLQISDLLKESDPDWSRLFIKFANQYLLDKNTTLTEIRHQYADMGSFNDLVVYKNGTFDQEGMEQLVHLKKTLYDAVVAEIIALRGQ